MSPTQRSKKYLEELGYRVAVVEKWNQWAKVRQDLFGCIDLLAIKPNCKPLGVQCTSHPNLTSRVDKCRVLGQVWLSTGHTQLEAWAWRKLKGAKRLVLDRREIPRHRRTTYDHDGECTETHAHAEEKGAG